MLVNTSDKIISDLRKVKTDTAMRGDVKIKLHNVKSGNTEFYEGHNTFMSDALNRAVREFGINYYSANNPFINAMKSLLLFHEQINDGDYHLPFYAKPYGLADSSTGNTAVDMGSLNPNEIENSYGSYKSVYDFSTSQCNGELKAVGYEYVPRKTTEKSSFTYNINDLVVGAKGNKLIIYNSSSKKLYEISANYNAPVFKDENKSDVGDGSNFVGYRHFVICSDGKCYAYGISSLKLYEYIFDLSTYTLTTNTYDVAGIEFNSETRFCTTDTDNKYIYCLCAGDSNGHVVYKIEKKITGGTTTMTIVNSVKSKDLWWTFYNVGYFNGGILLYPKYSSGDGPTDNGAVKYYFDTDLVQHHTTFTIFSPFDTSSYNGLVQNIFEDVNGVYDLYNTYNSYGQARQRFHATYPLMLTTYNLSETITKTASQTMKITYMLTEES